MLHTRSSSASSGTEIGSGHSPPGLASLVDMAGERGQGNTEHRHNVKQVYPAQGQQHVVSSDKECCADTPHRGCAVQPSYGVAEWHEKSAAYTRDDTHLPHVTLDELHVLTSRGTIRVSAMCELQNAPHNPLPWYTCTLVRPAQQLPHNIAPVAQKEGAGRRSIRCRVDTGW